MATLSLAALLLLLLLVPLNGANEQLNMEDTDDTASSASSSSSSLTLDSNTLNDTKSELDELLLLRQYGPIFGGPGGSGGVPGAGVGGAVGGGGGGCPLCDSSVYSYCSYKMIHDSCCCDFMAAPQLKPPQCYYSDCTLLYAKTCYEHMLIKNCCCNRPYR